MSQPKWLDWLDKSPDALADFILYLRARRKQAEAAQDAATDFAESREALGRKKMIDELINFANMHHQEETSLGRYQQAVGPKH